MMKEKRAPSRPVSLLALFTLFLGVVLSCGLTFWLGLTSPFSREGRFGVAVKDPQTEGPGFFTYGWMRLDRYYTLDQNNHITCKWEYGEDESGLPEDSLKVPVYPLSEDLRALEEQYGKIWRYSTSSGITSLVTDFYPPLSSWPYGSRLVILRDGLPPLIIDAQTLYWANAECDQNPPYLALNILALVASIVIVVMAIRRLRHKHVWLVCYGVFLILTLFVTYFMGIIDQ